MDTRTVWRSGVVLLFLALVVPMPVDAQQAEDVVPGPLNTRVESGITVPLGDFADYYQRSATFGLTAGYPIRDRLDLVLDLGVDLMKNDFAYVPDTRLWRYQAGVEADLLGSTSDVVRLTGQLGAGATTFRSDDFGTEERPAANQRFSSTYFTGSGGLRLGVRAPQGITWWLSGKLNWSPVAEADIEPLQRAARNELRPFGSATNVAITLGFSVP